MQPSPGCFFDRLPDELILTILRNLPPNQIQHVRRVNRRFDSLILKNWRTLPLIPANGRLNFGASSVSVEILSKTGRKFSEIQCYARGNIVGRFVKPLEMLNHFEAKRRKYAKIPRTSHGLCNAILHYFSILAPQFRIHIQHFSMKELQYQLELFSFCLRHSGLKIGSVQVELNISNENLIRNFFKTLCAAGCRKFIVDDFVSGHDLREDFINTVCPRFVYLHRIYVRITSMQTIVDTISKWKAGHLFIGIIRYNQCDVPTEDIAVELGLPLMGEGFFVDRSTDKKVLRFEHFPAHSKRTDERLLFVCEKREDLTQKLRDSIKSIVLKN